MNTDLFRGKLIGLVVEDPQTLAEANARWNRDSEYWRLLASDLSIPYSIKKQKEWFDKELDKDEPDMYFFGIRALAEDKLIGIIELDGISWNNGESWVGIGIGEREFWGKGYGSDAMRVILRYAFTELNLYRVSLNVFEYNTRGVRSYEKCGFKHEGRMCKYLNRDGKRWDLIFMGILRQEWERDNPS